MTERLNEPGRRPSNGELADMVYGKPMDETTEQAMLLAHRDAYQGAYAQAVDRGDPRAIEDAEQQLDAFYAQHPELR
jgi:hypothetical protein